MRVQSAPKRRIRVTRTSKPLARAVWIILCGITAVGTADAGTAKDSWIDVARATTLRHGDAVMGALPLGQPMHVEVAMKLRNKTALDAFIADNALRQASRQAPQPMSSDRFLAEHAPTRAQAQAVADYLTSRGFTQVTIAPNRLLVSADGTTRSAGDAFATSFAQVRTHDGGIAFANTDAARVPASLSSTVLAVVGLQTLHEAVAAVETAASGAVHPQAIAGHYPSEFQSIYGSNSSVFGGPASIGVITEGSLDSVLTDLDVFSTTGGRHVTYTIANQWHQRRYRECRGVGHGHPGRGGHGA